MIQSNTFKRILSAAVLILIVLLCFYFGRDVTSLLFIVAGIIVIDEIFSNFFRLSRVNPLYISSQIVFCLGGVAAIINSEIFWAYNLGGVNFWLVMALIQNMALLIYLFWVDIDLKLENIQCYLFWYIPFFVLLPVISILSILNQNQWIQSFIILLIINFGMDTGAWFTGRLIGKHKLWPSVSPNKSIEGLIGGMFFSGILGAVTFYFLKHKIGIELVLIFMLFGGLSQIGDLIQSKLKRQFDLKDSSNLIPGHGGVYDRLDSLLFLAPFFAIWTIFN